MYVYIWIFGFYNINIHGHCLEVRKILGSKKKKYFVENFIIKEVI